jgi:maltooligosyltrehalose trehalohydrolase
MTDAARPAWTPSLGAWPTTGGTAFRVWAPWNRHVAVVVERAGGSESHPLAAGSDGTHAGVLPGVAAGDRYRYHLDHSRLLPDPASRYQSDGVHGPSEVVDPCAFAWTDLRWHGRELPDLVAYELHVGTLTEEGTFRAAMARLPEIAGLGATAIELMPLADFPGSRNWGYDGAAIFAPARCYGTPDDLRQLIDTAHGLNLAVLLDVVYNHFGPDGAYASSFSPYYFTERHHTPWGAALNFDGENSAMVRAFFIENACHWIHEYHVDGFRLDATHAIVDDSPRHFLAELTERVRHGAGNRPVLVIAEDDRNLNQLLTPPAAGGMGLDAVWADDFHHQSRRLLAGDAEGYFRDYSGSAGDLASTIRRGWFYSGQHSRHFGRVRGTDPAGLSPERFVFCLQNHDQIGNRALGRRLHHDVDLAAYRAASVLLLTAPETPLLFMGQEWAASTPFLYFTDHHPELGRLVTEGRRAEFRHFSAFSDPAARERIPDPQALSTFLSSRLRWDERTSEPHASILRLYRALLELRRKDPAFRGGGFDVNAFDESTIVLERGDSAHPLLVIARLKGEGLVTVPGAWTSVLTTEDAEFAVDAQRLEITSREDTTIRFARPGAVIFNRRGFSRRDRRRGGLQPAPGPMWP